MAAVVGLPPPAPSIHAQHVASTHSCPACGTSVQLDIPEPESTRRKIAELEAQMELWKEKATAAVDKCADYEDQIRSLTQKPHHKDPLPRSNTTDSLSPSRPTDDPPRPSTAGATTSRFSFLTGRRTSPTNAPPVPPKDGPVPIDITLLNELERERTLRAKAEARAQKVDSEIEELSVQLFSQANEMVAEERRARAKLEERVETLERRDREKMRRLERLEKAVTRVERVKALLKEPEKPSLGAITAAAVDETRLAPPARR